MSEEDKVIKVTEVDAPSTTYRQTAVKVTEDGSSTHIMTNDNEDLKTKALRAEYAVTDLIDSIVDKARASLKDKAVDLFKSGVLEPSQMAARKDSADIGHLGPLVIDLVTVFEETMTNIEDSNTYDEEVRILNGYQKLLEEQVNVINSRLHFVKRVS